MDSARLEAPCQQRFECNLVTRICGQVMVKCVVKLVACVPFRKYTKYDLNCRGSWQS
jgi:hypothetical protein